jgi:SET domain-containing protein
MQRLTVRAPVSSVQRSAQTAASHGTPMKGGDVVNRIQNGDCMFIVRTSLRPSSIQGIGCFTEEPIKQGQVVWQYDPRFDIRIPLSELPSFPMAVQEHLLIYTYVEMVDGKEVMVYSADHSKHMNHSNSPNLLDTPDNLQQVAARDIEVGEELTCNYFSFDLDAYKKLSSKQLLGIQSR